MITLDPGPTTFLFAPFDDVATPFLRAAAAEEEELCVSAYAFTLAPLVAVMKANQARGVVQYLLADLSQSKDPGDHAAILECVQAGISTLVGTAPGGAKDPELYILHSKYLLGRSQSVVFTGSYNFSAAAAVQHNASQVFTSQAVWAAFRADFAGSWAWVEANEPQAPLLASLAA